MPQRGLLPALAAAAMMAACGGDDAPSKSEFIEEADAVCADGLAESQQMASTAFQNPQQPTPEEILALVQKLVEINRDTVAEVRALERPEGEEERISELLDMADRALAEAGAVQDPQQALAMVQTADTPQDPFYEANRAFSQYGFEECAE